MVEIKPRWNVEWWHVIILIAFIGYLYYSGVFQGVAKWIDENKWIIIAVIMLVAYLLWQSTQRKEELVLDPRMAFQLLKENTSFGKSFPYDTNLINWYDSDKVRLTENKEWLIQLPLNSWKQDNRIYTIILDSGRDHVDDHHTNLIRMEARKASEKEISEQSPMRKTTEVGPLIQELTKTRLEQELSKAKEEET